MTDQEKALQLARTSLAHYIAVMMPEYLFTPLHVYLISVFERALREPVRICLSMPPRHGKSQLVSQFLPAFAFGQDPKTEIIAISYGASLAHQFGSKVREQMDTPLYGMLFPNSVVEGEGKTGAQFRTVSGGQYLSTGVGGSITGFGSKLLLIDDPVRNRQDAFSPRMTSMRNEFFGSTAFSRLEPGASCIVLHTRWSEGDPIGYILSSFDNWEYIRLPAICDTEDDPMGRQIGEPLFPEKFGLDALAEIENTLGKADFGALYQQDPQAGSGSLWKPEYAKFVTLHNPSSYNGHIICYDCASELSDTADYTAVTVLARTRADDWHVLETINKRIDFMGLVGLVEELDNKYPKALHLVEKASNGIALLQFVAKQMPKVKMQPVSAHKNKLAQFSVTSSIFESGKIFFSKDANTNELLAQLAGWGSAGTEHDDMAVSLLHALYYIVNNHEVLNSAGSNLRVQRRGPTSWQQTNKRILRL